MSVRATRWSTPWFAVLVLAALVLTVPATAANAHAHLVESAPQEGASLSSQPEELVLTYDEPVEPAGDAALVLTAPHGTERVLEVDSDRAPEELRAPLDGPLEAGEHTVAWRIAARDGHVQEGSFAFVVDEEAVEQHAPDGDAPTEDDARDDVHDAVDESHVVIGDATEAQQPAADIDEGGGNWLIALALLALGGVVAGLLMLRGRRGHPSAADPR